MNKINVRLHTGFIVFMLFYSMLTIFAVLYSMSSSSARLFEVNTLTAMMVMMHIVLFGLSLIFILLIKVISDKYAIVWAIYTVLHLLVMYLLLNKVWVSIDLYSDFGIAQEMLLFLLKPLTIIHGLWTLFTSAGQTKKQPEDELLD